MEFRTFSAGPDDDDRRLDRIIRKFVPQENLAGIYKAIRKGLVKINDRKCDGATRVCQGDEIKIAAFLLENKAEASEKKEFSSSLQPVFHNEHILIINKPYDVTVHGDSFSLDRQVQEFYKASSNKSESLSFLPGPLHRLDRKTTGLLAFSWSLKGARWFSENIATHSITKKYAAVLSGILSDSETWEDDISRDESDEKGFHTVSVNSGENGKKALTKVSPVFYGTYKGKPFTYAAIQIFTGRTHQIRSQAAAHGHALLGDTAYGGEKINEKQDFFLHAQELNFPAENPSGLPSVLEAPLPPAFAEFLEKHRQ